LNENDALSLLSTWNSWLYHVKLTQLLGEDMPTKKELEAIIEGLGFDPSTPLEDYVKLGSFIYPKDAAVTLKWEGEYCEFKRADSWYFGVLEIQMAMRLGAWGLTSEFNAAAEFVEYRYRNSKAPEPTGLQAKISQSWDSLEILMLECDPDDIGLADTMMLTLPMGSVQITDLTFERSWTVDKSERYACMQRLRLGEELADVLALLTLTSTKKLGSKGIKELIAKVPVEVSMEDAERLLSSVEVTSSAQSQWSAFSTHEMVQISAGDFMMGALENDSDAYVDEKPRHKVTLTRDFMMGKYPVTQALWESVMGSNPSAFKGANRPVETVSWFEVVDFCNKLSKREGLEPAYTINGENVTCNWKAKGYRLPTEAEWEYSARAGESFKYAGSDTVDEVAWYSDNSDTGNGCETHPVGQKKPNGFGLYDMSGNVWEWAWDFLGSYSSTSQTDPTGPDSGSFRMFRGGSWCYGASSHRNTRVSSRFGGKFTDRRIILGFRLSRISP
jgi:formylglycine-generating enzyme required for sulfatase activity